MPCGICPWELFGLILGIIMLIVGIIVVWAITKWALTKGWVGEKFCIMLVIAVVVATYGCMHYDVKKLKCKCESSTPAGPTNSIAHK